MTYLHGAERTHHITTNRFVTSTFMRGARTTHRASSCATNRATRAQLALLRHDTENNLRIGALTLSLARAERDLSAQRTLPKPVASWDVQSGVCEFANDHNINLYLTCSSPLIEHDHEEGALRLEEHRWPATRIKPGTTESRLEGRANTSHVRLLPRRSSKDNSCFQKQAGTLQHDAHRCTATSFFSV